MGGLFHKLRHQRRCYVVCTIPRSGSNLLTDGLRATRHAGMPKQFFLPKFETRYGVELGLDPVADYPGYVRAIVNTKTTANEVFGFKLMSWYLDNFLTGLRDTRAFGDATTDDLTLLRNAFPRLRFVHILRRHKLRQALSTARALQTGLWKVQKGKTTLREPQFDAELIEQSLREAQRQEKIWQYFFQISLPRGMRIGNPVTIRQADEISQMWEERFLAERPSAYSPAAG